MANGNGSLTPVKTIGICISITVAVNSLSLLFIQEHGKEIGTLRDDMESRTDERYRASDAESDIRDNWRLINARFKNVDFRFERNETNINECLTHIRSHIHDNESGFGKQNE